MKVMMINSLDGLRRQAKRGLSSLSGPDQVTDSSLYASLHAFEQAVYPVFRAHERFQTASQRGELPGDVATNLESEYHRIIQRAHEHAQNIAEVDSPSEWTAWLQTSEDITDEVEAWIQSANEAVGFQTSAKPVRFALLALGSVALLGGAAYVIGKKGTMGRRSRRRRRRRRR